MTRNQRVVKVSGHKERMRRECGRDTGEQRKILVRLGRTRFQEGASVVGVVGNSARMTGSMPVMMQTRTKKQKGKNQ